MENQKRKSFRDGVAALDPFDKLEIYMHYFINHVALKHDVDIDVDGEKMEMKPLWRNNKAMSLGDFFDHNKHYFETDNGESWKQDRWAERYTLTETGAFRHLKAFNPKGHLSKIQAT